MESREEHYWAMVVQGEALRVSLISQKSFLNGGIKVFFPIELCRDRSQNLVGSSNFILSSKAMGTNNIEICIILKTSTHLALPYRCVVRLKTVPPVALSPLLSHYGPSLEHNHFLCYPKVSLRGACSIVSAVSAYSV